MNDAEDHRVTGAPRIAPHDAVIIVSLRRQGEDTDPSVKAQAGGVGSFIAGLEYQLGKNWSGTYFVDPDSNEVKFAAPGRGIQSLHSFQDGRAAAAYEIVNLREWLELHPRVSHLAVYGPPGEAPEIDHIDNPKHRALREYSEDFAKVIAETAPTPALGGRLVILMNDYQNWFVLRRVRELLPHAYIVVMLHTTMAESVPDHRVPYWRELLGAYASADCIWQHLEPYGDDLMTVARQVGLSVDWARKTVQTPGRPPARLIARPLGVDHGVWSRRTSDYSGYRGLPQVLKSLMGKRKIGLMDRASDPIKHFEGVLQVVRMLFQRHPELLGSVSVVALGAKSRTHMAVYGPYYQRCLEEEANLLQELRSDGQPAFVWLKEPIKPAQVAWFLADLDVMLNLSLDDGLHLGVFECLGAQWRTFLTALCQEEFLSVPSARFLMAKLQENIAAKCREFVTGLEAQFDLPSVGVQALLTHLRESNFLASLLGGQRNPSYSDGYVFSEPGFEAMIGPDRIKQLPGRMVLSRRAGAGHVLRDGALLVDPTNLDEAADALYRALMMGRPESVQRMGAMQAASRANSQRDWFDWFGSHSGLFMPAYAASSISAA